jgi:hypothetical protein
MNFTKSLTPAKILLCGAFVLVELLSLSSISLAQEPWTTKAPMPTARFWYSCEVVDGKIYVIGGANNNGASTLASVQEYDPVTDTWTTKRDMPTPRYNMASAVVDGKIYIMGGDKIWTPGWVGGLRTLEVYDPTNDTWDITKANMPTGRNGASGCVVNGIIYVMGGVETGGVVLKVVEAYNPATDTWTTKAPMPTGRWALSMPVVDGKIYAIGGSAGGGAGIKTVEVYDPGTDAWTEKADMLIGNCYFGTGIVDGIIYTIGGWISSRHSRVFAYDPVTDEWSERTAMPTARLGLGTGVVNKIIYAIGGALHYTMPPLSINEEYDPHHDLLPLIDKIEVDKSYAKPGTDSVCITTKIKDPSGITIMAHIEVPDQSPVDSLELFDDGNHNDGNAGDSLYANVWPVSSAEEQHYYVDLQVTRVDTDTVIHHISNMATFTTIGPVTVENYTFTGYDTIPNPGDKLKLKITLRNNGSADTATKVTARLISLDSLVTIITSSPSFGNIVAGQNAISSYKYTLTIDEEWPGNTSISILVEISGEDYPYWKDTLYIPVLPVNIKEIREPITRIYPNPTNDLLNIEISNSGKQGLEIEIRDITGKVIYQKKYNNANARFTEQFDLSGFTKGIYLIKVRQADRVYVGKIIVR